MPNHRLHAYSPTSTPQRLASSQVRGAAVEWPTMALWLAVVGSWVLVLATARHMPVWLHFAALTVLATWYMSLQHELLHGHPTRLDGVNRLMGLLPIALWYPYDLYKAHHLTHHQDQHLTEPGVDPESNYRHAAHLRPRWKLALVTSQRTVAGRLLLGPGLTVVHLTADVAWAIRRADARRLWIWAQHLTLAGALLVAVEYATAVSAWEYAAASYFGMGLGMLRSLYEHRPAALPAHRIVINEAALPWRLLYLNNNYHAVHHTHPGLPWYRIPSYYRADRTGYLERNGSFLLQGYVWLLRKHLWRPIDSPFFH
ncbi:fatty acid desaturase [Rhodoferax saidenbachensis]|uniref:Fatty acid desaturase n=1 Tax=Rhodoferax saidenbachensis TaxID=1484693 RepID=A0ABU1ZPD8_9BURK|nr:fatty acid desaturase [Rhodoferax saidenbachensis]MDR7307412.1 fatty acid desaturase [Rhodoferax saidenbachensis]